jgi:hypothetical protein
VIFTLFKNGGFAPVFLFSVVLFLRRRRGNPDGVGKGIALLFSKDVLVSLPFDKKTSFLLP